MHFLPVLLLSGMHSTILCTYSRHATWCAGPVAEQVLLLENIATSVLVGHDQLPSLHKILTEAAGILQMDVPDLYVRQVSFVSIQMVALVKQQMLC